jgi:serine/threonine-protein kinase
MRGSVAVPAVSASQVMPVADQGSGGIQVDYNAQHSQQLPAHAHGTAPNLGPNVPAAGAPAYTPPPDPLLDQVLAGRYLIQKKLGEGGMGAVYLATHTVLEKQVALKVLHGEFARKADLVERFMQEAKAASRIRHQNVIDISDFGSTPDGLVFFAMELLKGHDLHEEIARARLAGTRLHWDRTRHIFLQICGALSAAHAQGIVHRDLKPENIYLVEWLGHRDFVKLLDFGIAKLTEVSEGDRKLTRTGMLFGTPEYMSPEQARGEHVDHRVDIYAMGCILYQMVTGRVPFEAENFMGILSLHLTELPPPIPPPVFDQIGAPRELDAIIQRALEKDRDRRWQTIDEMANAIRALHGEEQVAIQEPKVPRVTTGTPAIKTDPTGARQRTQWTGQVSLPMEDDAGAGAAAKPGSKLPLILGVGVLTIGVAVGAFFLTRGQAGDGKTSTPAIAPDAGAGTGPATATDNLPPVPARVTLTLSSDPEGADIFDLVEQKPIGQTPMEFIVDGSRTARQYRLTKAGYMGKVIELVPDEDVPFTATLKKLSGASSGTAAAAVEVEVVPQKGRPGGTKGTAAGTAKATGAATGTATGPETMPGKDPDKPDKPPVKDPDKIPTKDPDKPPVKDPDKPPVKDPDKPPVKDPPDDDPGNGDPGPIKDPFGRSGGGTPMPDPNDE